MPNYVFLMENMDGWKLNYLPEFQYWYVRSSYTISNTIWWTEWSSSKCMKSVPQTYIVYVGT